MSGNRKVAAYYHAGYTRRVAEAMAAGARIVGWSAEVLDSSGYDGPRDRDLAVFYGMPYQHKRIFDDFRAMGRPVVIVDLGYFSSHTGLLDKPGHLKVAVDWLHPTGHFQLRKHPPHRFLAHGLETRPMRRGGSYILFAGVGPKSLGFYGGEHQAWDRNAVSEIRKATGREIIYRAKPNGQVAMSAPIHGTRWSEPSLPLEPLLLGAWAVVTHHSNVAIQAVRLGVPCFVADGAAAAVGLKDLSRIEDPRLPSTDEQAQFLWDLAYAQWTVAEMASGACWRSLVEDGALRWAVAVI